MLSIHTVYCIFSDELLNKLATECELRTTSPTDNRCHNAKKNMFQNPNSTLEIYNQLSTMYSHRAFPLVPFRLALTVPTGTASACAERRFQRCAESRLNMTRVIFGHLCPKPEQEWSLISTERELGDIVGL